MKEVTITVSDDSGHKAIIKVSGKKLNIEFVPEIKKDEKADYLSIAYFIVNALIETASSQ